MREVTSKLVRSCTEVLRTAKENHRIAIRWIKGHAEHSGNELADMLAKKGTGKTTTAEPSVPIPGTVVKQYLNDHYAMSWQNRWNDGGQCRQTKLFYPRVDESRLKKTKALGKQNLNLLIQVATGHALVGYHLSQWAEMGRDCKLCGTGEETTAHLYSDCETLTELRMQVTSLEYPKERELLYFFTRDKLKQLFLERSERVRGEEGYNTNIVY